MSSLIIAVYRVLDTDISMLVALTAGRVKSGRTAKFKLH